MASRVFFFLPPTTTHHASVLDLGYRGAHTYKKKKPENINKTKQNTYTYTQGGAKTWVEGRGGRAGGNKNKKEGKIPTYISTRVEIAY